MLTATVRFDRLGVAGDTPRLLFLLERNAFFASFLSPCAKTGAPTHSSAMINALRELLHHRELLQLISMVGVPGRFTNFHFGCGSGFAAARHRLPAFGLESRRLSERTGPFVGLRAGRLLVPTRIGVVAAASDRAALSRR